MTPAQHASAALSGGTTPTHLAASPSCRFQELRPQGEAGPGFSASRCMSLMEAPAHGGVQRAARQSHEEDSLDLDGGGLEARPPRSAPCRHNGARHSTPGTRPARPEEANIDSMGVNSQELLSALRLIAANPSVASALPPLECAASGATSPPGDPCRPRRDLHV